MNIFGRVFGGLLVLISLGWLASIAGLRPAGWFGSNQIGNTPGTAPNLTTNLNGTPNADLAGGAKSPTSNFKAGSTGAKASPGAEVEKDPRAANPSPAPKAEKLNQTPPTTVPVVEKAAPVAAGW